MPINLDTFRNLANATLFSSRDIVVRGEGDEATARLGNFIFSHSAKTNTATMIAFKAALENEYGVLGAHAFDTVLGDRAQMHKSLRACDVTSTLSRLNVIRHNRFIGEVNRQLDISPKMLELSKDAQLAVRKYLSEQVLVGVDLASLKTPAEFAKTAAARIDQAIQYLKEHPEEFAEKNSKLDTDAHKIAPRTSTETAAKDTEATGLRNLKLVFGGDKTSIADRMRQGFIGTGMRVNRSSTHPVLLEKLKTNGVEPGFIYRNDWSTEDTRGFMADIYSAESRAALNELKSNDQAFAKKCEGKPLREQILLAGRAHPAAMAAASELLLEEAAKYLLADGKDEEGKPLQVPEGVKNLAKAINDYYLSPEDMNALAHQEDRPRVKKLLVELKRELFTQIRDAVMSIGSGDKAIYERSTVFKHFQDRAIVKLDYNEADKFAGASSATSTFMRPERIITTRKPILGQIYRFTSRQSADDISAGAVTEALANDLTCVAGVPSQELEIVRGQYSDGHPKIMLAAKFANGYQDLEAGMLKDGRVVKPNGAPEELQMESLGKYKAFFLVTADRDGIGKRGQNKGFVGGKFFAIDPGHSLEGNGKYLKISDDLSFQDTYGKSLKPRFNNFSVFDDDSFYAKFQGVLHLRELSQGGAFAKIFNEYRTVFDPNEKGISDVEKALRTKIVADINKKETEFNESLKKILDVTTNNLELYDDLSDDGPFMQQGAIETVSNLEKLTSPTTWVSKRGQVALKHLEVVPETRVPWKAALRGDSIAYYCETKMSYETSSLLENLAKDAGVRYEMDEFGFSRLIVPKDKAEHFFAVFSEENVKKLTHPEEYQARKAGGNGLKEAKLYKPVPYRAPAADPRPLLKAEDLPDFLHVPIEYGGKTLSVKFPKTHYQNLLSTRSSVHRPRSEGELRYLLSSQVNRGIEVLGALQSGKSHLFEPTRENIVALTYAIHATALKKGEYMYRGSFSIEDPNGDIARWLDRASDVYIRTSTHAKPYQEMQVDGHLNMPRGYDVPTGAGGLLNGMRTFHYFTIPDTDHLQDAGGSGPKRRLFLKCETFGIFCSTAHFHPFNKADAKSEGMKTRWYRPGDIIESIQHGASLFASFFTPKEAQGIRKENLTEAQKTAIQRAFDRLLNAHLDKQGEILIAENVLDGGGIKTLVDNIGFLLEKMLPEDDEKRAQFTSILDDMLGDFQDASFNKAGDFANRIGNEIMIDAQDLL